ncbi:MAG: alpha-E domain-containing protein [Planctomycetota bacterium]|nr:alpha-E domain-containing protein [Planctomycetota bacterium]
MLSRTAQNLFWISRYLERAELTARLLEVGYRIALMPSAGTGYQNEWSSILSVSGSDVGYKKKYGPPKQEHIEHYLFHDLDNPNSVASCVSNARENSRAVRTALTTQVWDVMNTGYQELQQLAKEKYNTANLPALCDWTKNRVSLIRGAIESTQLEDEGYDFLNLGYFIERADNTARLLDVKYYVLLPTPAAVGGEVDHYQWSTLLRAMSAYRAFRWAYGGLQTPHKVADFLILNVACPRSLLHCLDRATRHFNRLEYRLQQQTEAQKMVAKLKNKTSAMNVDQIFQQGLHEFLTDFVAEIDAIGESMRTSYF